MDLRKLIENMEQEGYVDERRLISTAYTDEREYTKKQFNLLLFIIALFFGWIIVSSRRKKIEGENILPPTVIISLCNGILYILSTYNNGEIIKVHYQYEMKNLRIEQKEDYRNVELYLQYVIYDKSVNNKKGITFFIPYRSTTNTFFKYIMTGVIEELIIPVEVVKQEVNISKLKGIFSEIE